ncbi:hypothetical protein D3C87_1509660 [compost metagenome]
MNGLKVALVITVAAFDNSVKPMIEVSAVLLTICTANPTVGAIAMRSACGSTTWRICCTYPSARLADASHCPFGTASTQPRQISARNAPDHKVRAAPAASHGGTSTPISDRPKNARNSCISKGVPWNSSI